MQHKIKISILYIFMFLATINMLHPTVITITNNSHSSLLVTDHKGFATLLNAPSKDVWPTFTSDQKEPIELFFYLSDHVNPAQFRLMLRLKELFVGSEEISLYYLELNSSTLQKKYPNRFEVTLQARLDFEQKHEQRLALLHQHTQRPSSTTQSNNKPTAAQLTAQSKTSSSHAIQAHALQANSSQAKAPRSSATARQTISADQSPIAVVDALVAQFNALQADKKQQMDTEILRPSRSRAAEHTARSNTTSRNVSHENNTTAKNSSNRSPKNSSPNASSSNKSSSNKSSSNKNSSNASSSNSNSSNANSSSRNSNTQRSNKNNSDDKNTERTDSANRASNSSQNRNRN